MPYRFVWSAAAPAVLATAFAHVHLSVLLLGFTPGLPEVLGVPVQPLNLSPPGVSFVCEFADGLLLVVEEAEVVDCVLDCACSAAFACACADAFALGPAAAFDSDDSSAFFAWPLFSAEADAETVAEAVTLVEACAAA